MMRRGLHSLFCLFLLACFSFTLNAQPASSSVARLSFIYGTTSFLPAGEKTWVKATLNRPLITGDDVWTGKKSFIELQLDGTSLRLGSQTILRILNLTKKFTQVQLPTGTIILRVWKLKPGQIMEVSTPNLAFLISRPGYYRIFVNNQAHTTLVTVREGRGKIIGKHFSYQIRAGRSCWFSPILKADRCSRLPLLDPFDKWSLSRDKLVKFSRSSRYVSTAVIGVEDLAPYGTWRTVKQYGPVWIPNQVDPDWAPYRTGHWIWLRHWGWTWVDDQPWGFAPFHYGRWVYIDRHWGWVPGPREIEPVFAPALVVFVGNQHEYLDLDEGVSGIGWFPLGPGEVYRPPYEVSRQEFIQINRANTQINNTYITNVYNNNMRQNYQNINVTNAVTAVPTQAFLQAKPVEDSRIAVSRAEINTAPKEQVLPLTPVTTSVLGGSEPAATQPPENVLDSKAVVTVPPPAEPPPLSEEQNAVSKTPGVQPTPTSSAEESKQFEVVNPDQPAQSIEATPLDKPIPSKEVQQAPPIAAPELQDTSPKVQEAPPEPSAPEVQSAPPVQSTPEVQESPPVQSAPEVQEAPPVQPAPEVQEAPPAQSAPEVKAPPTPSAPEGQEAPPVQSPPELQAPPAPSAPEVQAAPPAEPTPEVKVQTAPPVQATPEVQAAPPVQSAPEVQTAPPVQATPEVQVAPAPAAPEVQEAPPVQAPQEMQQASPQPDMQQTP